MNIGWEGLSVVFRAGMLLMVFIIAFLYYIVAYFFAACNEERYLKYLQDTKQLDKFESWRQQRKKTIRELYQKIREVRR